MWKMWENSSRLNNGKKKYLFIFILLQIQIFRFLSLNFIQNYLFLKRIVINILGKIIFEIGSNPIFQRIQTLEKFLYLEKTYKKKYNEKMSKRVGQLTVHLGPSSLKTFTLDQGNFFVDRKVRVYGHCLLGAHYY